MDKILIRGLKIRAIVGILPWERKIPQTLLLDVDLTTDIRAAAASEDISKTVDYSAVAERLTAFIQESRFQLIETLAERCAGLILEEFGVPEVRLLVSKPEAVPATDTVCIEINRSRNA